MKVIVLKRSLERIGVDKKNKKRYEKAIESLCLGKDDHPLFIKGGEEKSLPF
jgi:hypothetical protein